MLSENRDKVKEIEGFLKEWVDGVLYKVHRFRMILSDFFSKFLTSLRKPSLNF